MATKKCCWVVHICTGSNLLVFPFEDLIASRTSSTLGGKRCGDKLQRMQTGNLYAKRFVCTKRSHRNETLIIYSRLANYWRRSTLSGVPYPRTRFLWPSPLSQPPNKKGYLYENTASSLAKLCASRILNMHGYPS